MRNALLLFAILMLAASQSFSWNGPVKARQDNQAITGSGQGNKIVVYQVFTRLFGNTVDRNKPWGTIEENGVGKFRDFTPLALKEIHRLGVTHLWLTGVLHHDVIRDYKVWGISDDDPDVVKGRAGSPYAIKDYYNVDPDLAADPSKRMEEFLSLLERAHREGLKVIIDIVPNHVARNYHAASKPAGTRDFGEDDNKSVVYARDNNFYYLPGESFKVPELPAGEKPLGGEKHPLADGMFTEVPAKWTGNGSRLAQPRADDWYETVKLNYGIRPDGSKDFDPLPQGSVSMSPAELDRFWQGKNVPGTWTKMRDICLFWLKKGVDGFRFDMAEMVPVEFWSYLNGTILATFPKTLLLAEVYNPSLYRSYIQQGRMGYLYDKVAFYDTLKKVMQGKASPDRLVQVVNETKDIAGHMLHFLENHDEQRIASPEFAGDARKGIPAMVVSATIGTSPTLVYFGQEVGERGAENTGYGKPSRTSIFDYTGVPAHQRWMNGGRFDGGKLTAGERELRTFYRNLLNFTIGSPALTGEYRELQTYNREKNGSYPLKIFSFARWNLRQKLVVIASFDPVSPATFELRLPAEIINAWKLKSGTYTLQDQLQTGGSKTVSLHISGEEGKTDISLPPLGCLILELNDHPVLTIKNK